MNGHFTVEKNRLGPTNVVLLRKNQKLKIRKIKRVWVVISDIISEHKEQSEI